VGTIALGVWALSALQAGRRGRPGPGELAAALLVPWLLGNVLLTRDGSVFAESRYWLFLVPFLCLTWGMAIAWLLARRRIWKKLAGGAILCAFLATYVVALPWNWRPETRRENWRAAARYIEAHAGPNDAILIHVDYVRTAFLRYYRGDQPVYFPFGGPVNDMEEIAPPLEGMSRFDTIWLVESHLEGVDDGRLVERWLGERYPLVTEQFPAGITLRAYAVRLFYPTLPSDVRPLDAELAPGMILAGCRLGEEEIAARDDVYHPPSGWLHVTLYWRRADAVRRHFFDNELPCRCAITHSQFSRHGEFFDCIRQGLRIFDRRQQTRLVRDHNFPAAGRIGGNQRPATGRRFKQAFRQALAMGREGRDVGAAPERGDVFDMP